LASRLLALRHFFQARLSRRIVWWVFASIVVIEALILLPSIYRRQQELLAYLKEIAAAETSGLLEGLPANETESQILTRLEKSLQNAKIRGGALYRINGELIGIFGTPPQLDFRTLQANPQSTLYQQPYFDAAWNMAPLKGRYLLIIRHDATQVQQEILAFMVRIAGLVLIIGIFVTFVTLLGLDSLLISPVILLRQDLLNAGAAIRADQEPPKFASLQLQRQDELGEVIAAFSQMYQQVSDAIAERKQAEKALASLAEVGELSAMIVHEVRNPLATVLLGLQSFQKLDLSPAYQTRLKLSMEEADRLQRLLNEILLYTKCQRLQRLDFDLNQWLLDLQDSLHTLSTAQSRTLKFRLADSPLWICGDQDRLKQVLINLVSNACEAIAEQEQVTCSLHPHQTWIQLEVSNGGNPIPPEKLAQITQPFFTTKPTGNGLGLAIVKRIVEAHDGRLEIESGEAIAGTRVRIYLPLSNAQYQPQP
jgi:signal transduction histidine kinase